MASSNRIYTDNSGKMFLPMNVDGSSWNERFFTTGKLAWTGVSVACGVLLFAWLGSAEDIGLTAKVIYSLIYFFILSLIVRYVIMQEKYYYKIYEKMKSSEIGTPALFWNIASIKETDNGAILIYADGKIGVIFKLIRDTIIGRQEDFRENHFDGISDFYNEIVRLDYKFVQMSRMEPAGKDPRIDELDKLCVKSDNENINKLMRLQVGHIKNITRATLFEQEYFLMYSDTSDKTNSILDDAHEICSVARQGAFIGYQVLDKDDIVQLVKEIYNVSYFDSTEATLEMFRENGILVRKPFEVVEVGMIDGEVYSFNERERKRLAQVQSKVKREQLPRTKVEVKRLFKWKERGRGVEYF